MSPSRNHRWMPVLLALACLPSCSSEPEDESVPEGEELLGPDAGGPPDGQLPQQDGGETGSPGDVPDAGCVELGAPSCPGDSPVPSYESVQLVFDRHCVLCHQTGAKMPNGLRLTAAESYDALVGKPSDCSPSVLRVAPGEPAKSLLWQKINGAACCGMTMPPRSPGLKGINYEAFCKVERWISAGAPKE